MIREMIVQSLQVWQFETREKEKERARQKAFPRSRSFIPVFPSRIDETWGWILTISDRRCRPIATILSPTPGRLGESSSQLSHIISTLPASKSGTTGFFIFFVVAGTRTSAPHEQHTSNCFNDVQPLLRQAATSLSFDLSLSDRMKQAG